MEQCNKDVAGILGIDSIYGSMNYMIGERKLWIQTYLAN